jgi:ATP-dependent helicase/nuclease subunit A
VRCVSGGGEDLLQTPEVATLRSLLQTISNPRQDIPLIAVLASPVFGFTADDLAAFRAKRRYGCVYDALEKWEDPKATRFIGLLKALRRSARLLTLARLLEDIFVRTGMVSIYAAMENGQLREQNLQTFYSLAVDFESAGRRDLAHFLEFLDGMEEKGLIAAGEQTSAGAVTLMSIHKSKGLEFPVVFVSNLSREFNRESARAQVLCDRELGLGLTAVDPRNRIRFPTVAKRAIALKTVSDSLSEELRVLYVALTRARDRLIMTYASGSLEKEIGELPARMDLCPRELLTRDVVCPGQWVLLAALLRTEAGALFALGGKPEETTPGVPPWQIRVLTPAGETGETMPEELPQEQEVDLEAIRRGLAFRYGHDAATKAPSKQTATQRKGREKDAEAAENTEPPKPYTHKWRKPAFLGGGDTGKDYGNAMHKALQHLPFGDCTDEDAVRQAVSELVLKGFLTAEEEALVDCGKLAAFFATDLGRRLRAGGNVLREFKFSILDDGEKFDPALRGEKILLQGVVDCALVEEDGITVVDFKTDRVTEETLPERVRQYRPQVLAYAGALERIYGKPVKEAVLYFFQMGEIVPVE